MLLPAKTCPGFTAGVFSFALAIAFVPSWSAAGDSPRWILLAFGALPALWMRFELRLEHWLGVLLISFAAVSLSWSAGPYDGIDEIFKMLFLAGMFVIGGSLVSLRPVYTGLALGFTVNSAIVIAQWCGWHGIVQLVAPAGLFMNKNYLAEPAALVLIALVASRLWWFIPGVLPSVVLPGARGALLALAAAGVGWLWTRSRTGAVVAVLWGMAAGWILYRQGYGGHDVTDRVLIWQSTASGLDWLGHGIGSFYANFPTHAPYYDLMSNRPAHAHNDLLEMAYELGPAALLYVAIVALVLLGPFGAERLILFGFIAEGLFGFPLHHPIPAAMAALAAGWLCYQRFSLRYFILSRRADLQLGNGSSRRAHESYCQT